MKNDNKSTFKTVDEVYRHYQKKADPVVPATNGHENLSSYGFNFATRKFEERLSAVDKK